MASILVKHFGLKTFCSLRLFPDDCRKVKRTHHFKVARSNDQVVYDIVDLCDQGQDGGLNQEETNTHGFNQ